MENAGRACVKQFGGNRTGLRGLYRFSITISKGQLMAPVGQTSSHRVHHLLHERHSSFLITVTTLSTSTRMLQWHTLTQSPHPSHFSRSITGTSTTISASPCNHPITTTGWLNLTFVSRMCFSHAFESFLIANYDTMALQPDYPFLFQGLERPAHHLADGARHSCHLLLSELWF